MRLFYALWPDPHARAALAAAATALTLHDARPVRTENLHLTICFLGAVPPATTAYLLAQDFAHHCGPVEIAITAAGWWKDSRSTWLAPLETPPALTVLRQTVLAGVRAAGLESVVAGTLEYRPHVTVARSAKRAPRVTGAIEVAWTARRLALIQSHTEALGARYEVLREWPLAGRPGA